MAAQSNRTRYEKRGSSASRNGNARLPVLPAGTICAAPVRSLEAAIAAVRALDAAGQRASK